MSMMLPPTLPGGQEGIWLKPSQYWSINAHTQHPHAAELFVNYLLNSVNGGKALGLDRGIPVSSVVRHAVESESLTPQQQQEFAYISQVIKVAKPIDAPPPAAYSRIRDLFDQTIVDEVQYNKLSPMQAAQQFISQANSILSQPS